MGGMPRHAALIGSRDTEVVDGWQLSTTLALDCVVVIGKMALADRQYKALSSVFHPPHTLKAISHDINIVSIAHFKAFVAYSRRCSGTDNVVEKAQNFGGKAR